jgi:hypothetical protein
MEGPGFSDRLRAALPSGPIDARDWLPEAAFNDGHHTLVAGAEAFTDRLLREAA